MAVEPFDPSSLPDVLEKSLPLSDDPIGQGDDHIRLLKTVVQNMYNDYLSEKLIWDGRLQALEAMVSAGVANDAARLGGQLPAFYRDAGNLDAGILDAARLSGTYGINITGNAATATSAAVALTANHANDSALFNGLTLAQVQSSFQGTSVSASAAGAVTLNTTPTSILTASFTASADDRLAIVRIRCKRTGSYPTFGLQYVLKANGDTIRTDFMYTYPVDTGVAEFWEMNTAVEIPAGKTNLELFMGTVSGSLSCNSFSVLAYLA